MSRMIAVIPARGGSKRVPHKNRKLCAGKPLVSWTIEAAKMSNGFHEIIVSTDDQEIAKIAYAHNINVHERSIQYAQDSTTMLETLQNFLIERDFHPDDVLVLLQPTSPLRQARHIKEALEIFRAHKAADSLVSVCACPKYFQTKNLLKCKGAFLFPYLKNTQTGEDHSEETTYGRNGPAILMTSVKNIQSGYLYGSCCLPYVMDAEYSLDIDTLWDFDLAQMILQFNLLDKK